MKEYYLHDGQNQIGLFSLEELKDKGVTLDSYVWKEGMTDWVKVKELKELNEIIAPMPPPFKRQDMEIVSEPFISQKSKIYISEKTGTFIGRYLRFSLIIVILICTISYLLYQNNQSYDNPHFYNPAFQQLQKTPEELRMELVAKEKQNPAQYLNPKITMRANLIGEKIFEGTITNTASVAIFKDVLIQFTFLSKTDAAIGNKSITVYEILKPQQTISIGKVKSFIPKDTKKFIVTVVNATSVE